MHTKPITLGVVALLLAFAGSRVWRTGFAEAGPTDAISPTGFVVEASAGGKPAELPQVPTLPPTARLASATPASERVLLAPRPAGPSPITTGSVHGRVLLERQGAEGVLVSLRSQSILVEQKQELEQNAKELLLHDDSIPESTKQRALDSWHKSGKNYLTSCSLWGPAVATQTTTGNGEFLFEDLDPDAYQLSFEFPVRDGPERNRMHGRHRTERNIRIRPSEALRITDVRLPYWAEYLRVRQSESIQAVVRVRCDQAGLAVQVEDAQTKTIQEVGKTDAKGNLTFDWHEPAPMRILLFDKANRRLGGTDKFVLLRTDRDNGFDISVAQGQLKLSLPHGTGPSEREAVQYTLQRLPAEQNEVQTHTVFGSSAVRDSDVASSAPDSIEFKRLRPGDYAVDARFLVQDTKGRWLPIGTPLRGSARVVANQRAESSLR